MKHIRPIKTCFDRAGKYRGVLMLSAKGWAVHNDRGTLLGTFDDVEAAAARLRRQPRHAIEST
jgi:hypothetical protein